MNDIVEIIIYGRGGQGGKTAGMLLAKAALADKKEMQAFPEYGPERTGAPVKTFVRISKLPIKTFTPVLKPNIALFLDPSILKFIDSKDEFAKNTQIIVNTKKSKLQIKKEFKLKNNIYAVDGTKIAIEVIGKNIPNTAMLGAISKITKIVSINSLIKVSREHFNKKIGHEKAQLNLDAIKKAHKQAK